MGDRLNTKKTNIQNAKCSDRPIPHLVGHDDGGDDDGDDGVLTNRPPPPGRP